MLNVTSEYALRAMVFLARSEGSGLVSGTAIAEEARVPRKYLSKILGDLVRAGLLEGTRGRRGGFKLARPAKDIFLEEVLAPFETVSSAGKGCPFGNPVCSDTDPCAGHSRWLQVKEVYQRFLTQTSIHEVSIKRDATQKGTPKAKSRKPARGS